MREEQKRKLAARRRRERARKQRTRRIVLTVALVLVVALASIGGTLAWLVDKTEPVVNTFTPSDINIGLTETTEDYKMVPGCDIAKDPKVTVNKGSEACWLFVKIEKSANYDTYLNGYTVADGWTALTGVDGVYYREVAENDTADQSFYVLKGKDGYTNGYVTVKDSVTKAQMNALNAEGASKLTLTFKAYAVQKENISDVKTAWTQANPN